MSYPSMWLYAVQLTKSGLLIARSVFKALKFMALKFMCTYVLGTTFDSLAVAQPAPVLASWPQPYASLANIPVQSVGLLVHHHQGASLCSWC